MSEFDLFLSKGRTTKWKTYMNIYEKGVQEQFCMHEVLILQNAKTSPGL